MCIASFAEVEVSAGRSFLRDGMGLQTKILLYSTWIDETYSEKR